MAGQNPGSPTDFQYFYEDEVFKINNSGQVIFGLVLENYETNSSDQESDVETMPIQKGEIRVVWHPSGNERVVSEKSVGLADRSLMPGDVVRRMIRGKDTQRGYCRDIIMTAAVQIVGTNHVIPCVASERLQPLEEFTSDLAVCLDSWVGTSKTVHSKLRLVSADGSRLEYPDPENCPLEDCSVRQRRSAFYSPSDYYYPGQIVTCPLGSLEHATWIHTTKDMKAARKHKMREYKFTVEGVEAESVGVHWQCRALCTTIDAGGPPQQPRFLVEGEELKRLKLLNVFEPCTLQVGDRSFLTIKDDDKFTTKKQWRKAQSKYYRAVRRATRPQRSKDKEEPKEGAKDTHASNPKPAHSDQTSASKHLSHGPSKAKKRSLHNRDLIKSMYYTPNHTAKPERSELKPADDKMEVDVVVNHAPEVKDADDNATEDKSVGQSSEPPMVTVELYDSKDAVGSSPEISKDIPENVQASDQSKEGIVLAEPAADAKNDGQGISQIVDKDSKEVIVNGDCIRNESSNSLLVHNEDDDENWENTSSDDATDTDSGATWSSRCSSGANSAAGMGPPGVGKKSPQLATKFLRGARLKRTARRAPAPAPAAKVVVETLCTTGKANVVWQDGTIELGIPSTQLYPIHHLDNQECFPGDFVVLGDAGGAGATGVGEISQRDYGVVQKVDHHGRTAVVKWFRTYTTGGEPIPELLSENEVSVYDLKDHPDFQYRPGTVVIRVANFTGTETNCTAGQVIDNFPSGRVKVWWADGHTSMCWPQDLYKVGEYDSDDGELWAEDNDGSDEASWVTQSDDEATAGQGELPTPSPDVEPSARIIGLPKFVSACKREVVSVSAGRIDGRPLDSSAPKIPKLLECRVAAHIERGRVAMQKLEEMFFRDPKLQTQEVMRKLLNLYKECRFLDRLMGTTFFHEESFQDLLERVREREETASSKESQRVIDQVNRLFSTSSAVGNNCNNDGSVKLQVFQNSSPSQSPKPADGVDSMLNVSPIHNEENKSELSDVIKMDCDEHATAGIVENHNACMDVESDNNPQILVESTTPVSDPTLAKAQSNEDSGMECQMFSNSLSVNNTTLSNNSSERSFPSCDFLVQDSTTEDPQSVLSAIRRDLAGAGTSSGSEAGISEETARNVCYKLCSLIRSQLVLAHAEVSRRRPALLAQFLNKVMTLRSTIEVEQFPYHFTVQYGALVVSLNDVTVKKEDGTDENEPPEYDYEDADPVEANNAPVEPEETAECKEKPAEEPKVMSIFGDGFAVLESAPAAHRFQLSMLQPSEPRLFFQAVRREMKLLKSDLPPLVWVRSFEDRIDLLSLMIGGPEKTPYEDGLFLFDVQLGGEYPKAPPLCHYISYCTDRLNPNLYEDGKVCVSLLGTWSGRGVEVWGKDSSLLQVIVSLQGLILNSEPYFNEAGYEKQKGSQQGRENSRMYNEMVILKLVQSMTKLVTNPPEIFKTEILSYLAYHGQKLCKRLDGWMAMSETHNGQFPDSPMTPDTFRQTAGPSETYPPEFPLIPASRGFCLTLKSSLECYRKALQTCIPQSVSPQQSQGKSSAPL